ncbi:hypothetical protein HDU98_006288 [Podochytrium sp. JEL0797]|nr:hypothetical protein HDU98_006288 [Podochytrium sp. JEL0797]
MNRISRLGRLGAFAGIGLAGAYGTDRTFFASAGQRSLVTVWTGIQVAWIYKMQWEPGNFDAVHSKAASLVYDTCTTNSGLYIKFGQQLSVLGCLWALFKRLYDSAPPVPFSEVQAQIRRDFGKEVHELFDGFEESPTASASIAQVHKAFLIGSTIPVAVKIQKPAVSKQVEADLFSFSLVLNALQFLFDLKLTWMLPTINQHLREELDFIHEANNAEKAQRNLEEVSEFDRVVHIPKVYWDLTSPRVMTTEWIDGIPFVDVEGVKNTWGVQKVDKMVTTLVDLFSDQIFRTGFVHCDPHPGNIIIRACPSDPKLPQIVLLDHGLYTQCSPTFIKEYRSLWVSLFTHDMDRVESIVSKWGIRDVQLLAMGVLQRPWSKTSGLQTTHVLTEVLTTPGAPPPLDDGHLAQSQQLEMQQKMKQRFQQYLENTDIIPRELIFIGRNLNIVRSNNKLYGSVVNRINLTGLYAIKVVEAAKRAAFPPIPFHTRLLHSPIQTLTSLATRFRLLSTVAVFSLAFHFSRFWNFTRSALWTLRCVVLGVEVEREEKVGFEELMEEAVRRQVYEQTGVVLDKDAFDA